MLGSVKDITSNPNNQKWDIDISGLEFEDYISSIIEHSLTEYYNKGLRIKRTSRTRDNGKDLIINSKIPFSLFGKQFNLKEQNSICIYVEFKSTNNSKIELDKFSKNILMANRSSIDYFVLVTNKSIVPFSYYEASQNAKDNGYEFYLVDQFLLANFLKKYNALCGKYVTPKERFDLSADYQLNHCKKNGRPYLELYLRFRNYTEQIQICKFQLKSDRNWLLSENQFEVILNAGESVCKCIGITKEYFDGIEDILVEVTLNEKSKKVIINGHSVDYDFETPLVGTYHKETIKNIIENAQNNTSLSIINLQGEAGIGKTRIIDEAIKDISESGINVIHFICAENKEKTTAELLLYHIKNTIKNFELNKLEDIANVPMHFNRYAIVIEDIHNADKSLFSFLKLITSSNTFQTPFIIITAGRNDYTVFNESYFSYLSWLENESQNNIINHTINKLTNEECKNMIASIIVEAPKYVIDKIHTASENNPFYICQFIEYMLETKLIYLMNRNTVGITNVTTFSKKLYIPNSVEDLIKLRFDNLEKEKNGKNLQSFLILLSFYGIEAPQEIYKLFFCDENYDTVDILYKRHFVKLTRDNNITFEHENIFLFLQETLKNNNIIKNISSILTSNEKLLELFSDLKKAIVYFYMGNYKLSEKFIQVAIDEINGIKNISSCNLSPQYFEVYEIIYKLARKKKDQNLQRKTILAYMYIALHNLSVARGSIVIEKAIEMIKKHHSQDTSLYLTAMQMQAHLYMQSDRISQAKKILLELLAQERKNKSLFDDETRFDLFDRISSVYIQENHKEPAILYNQLSYEVAEKLNDKKLITLSKIILAKIKFYSDTTEALKLMTEAKKILQLDMAPRINCHNSLGILTASLVINFNDPDKLSSLNNNGQQLLKLAMEVEYPAAIIRSHYLLAVINYIKNNKKQARNHIEAGMTDCIRNGIAKMMPQFYCLQAIIAASDNSSHDTIYKYFQTMIQHMRQCDQLFLGALDFTYHNIILLTNYIIFLYEYGLESEIYQFLSEIKYYGSNVICDFKCDKNKSCFYSCVRNIDVFKRNYKAVKNGGLLFVKKNVKYCIHDKNTTFYISLGV